MNPTRNKAIWLIIILFLIKTVIVFCTEMDHSGDGWGYACEILKNNFLSGHHLLYNITGFIWLKLFCWLPLSPIKLLTWMNVAFSSGILFASYKIIGRIVKAEPLLIGILLLLASCFGFYRYSLENETYIIPLFFGVISIYYLDDNKKSHRSWISASIACLYHQIYIFWLIPILVINIQRTRQIRILWYSIFLVLIPYFIASYTYNKTIYNIVFQDFNNGLINNYFNTKNFLIGCVNLIRSVSEIHGRIGTLMLKIPAFSILGIILIIGLLYVLIKLFKNTIIIRDNYFYNIFKIPEFYILILTIIFSFYSNGNAEFMVSIPFLIVFIAIKQLKINIEDKYKKYIIYLGLINITWNTIFYILPFTNPNITASTVDKVNLICSLTEQLDFTNDNKSIIYHKKNNDTNVADTKSSENKTFHRQDVDTIVFISSEAATLFNCIDYIYLTQGLKKSKEVIFIYPDDTTNFNKYRHYSMYTDLNSDKTVNRAALTQNTTNYSQQTAISDSTKKKITTYRISRIRRLN